MMRAQKKKKAMADNRALELGDLRAPQASQELPNSVAGTLEGTSVSGGAAGLERVVGAGKMSRKGRGKAGAGQSGAGVISDLNIPVISGIARIFGLGKKGKKQGRKAREDERLAMEVKGLKDKMKGGSYIDPAFGVINQPQGTSAAFTQVATEGPLGAGYSGAGMAKAQGEKMAQYLKELHGEGYAKEFAGGFWGALASIAAPLIGSLFSGKGKKGRKGKKGGMMEYSDEELERIMETPPGSPASGRRAPASSPAPAPQLPIVAALREGRPLPAAAGATAVQAAAAAPAMAMARRAPSPARAAAAIRLSPEAAPGEGIFARMGVASPASITPSSSPEAVAVATQLSGRKKGRPASAELVDPKAKGDKKDKKGGAMMKANDGRKRRAEIVKRVMRETGLSMIEASKYVKQHGLF